MHRLLLALALLLPGLGAGAQDAPKTLRYAFRVAETGFDPAKIQDLYSRVVTPHIFEALVGYDHLARPAKLKPLTTTELPVPLAPGEVAGGAQVLLLAAESGAGRGGVLGPGRGTTEVRDGVHHELQGGWVRSLARQ